MGGRILAGRYELIEKIGEGGMSVVFKSRDRLLNRLVAIKILRPEYTKDAVFIENFRKESQTAAGLVHPNIVNVYDVGQEGNIYYIVMELVEGPSLADVIKKEGALDPRRAAAICKEVASALSMAHKHGLIHRDVKSHNIMLTGDGTAKITDFGIAQPVTSNTLAGDQKKVIMGSVHYFSPEQARGGYVDEKSDIYSLGIVLFEMLTGRVPFDGETAVEVAVKQMNEAMVRPTRINPSIPQDLEDIVLKATDKVAINRYRSMDDMIIALNFVKYSKLAAPDKFNIVPGNTQEFDTESLVTMSHSKSVQEHEEEEQAPMAKPAKKKKEKTSSGLAKQRIIAVVLALILALAVSFIISKFTNRAPKSFPVPSIVGMQSDEAQELLAQKGLTLIVERSLPDDEYDNGQIMSQQPSADSMVKSGQTVKVTVSLGSVTPSVPNVIGKTFTVAKYLIELDGYKVSVDKYDTSEDIPKDSIISQIPEGGTKLKSGSTVSLVISQGSEEDLEASKINLVGMKYEDALKAIEEKGFKLGTVNRIADDTVPEDCVISQSPNADTSLNEGQAVNLTVSSGPAVKPQDPQPPVEDDPDRKSVALDVDFGKAASEEFSMTVSVSDGVSASRTPIKQEKHYKSEGTGVIQVSGSGSNGVVIVMFDDKPVYQYSVDFENYEATCKEL